MRWSSHYATMELSNFPMVESFAPHGGVLGTPEDVKRTYKPKTLTTRKKIGRSHD